MARLSFDVRETSLLRDVVDTCRKASDWPVPFLLLDQLRDLLHADDVTFGLFDTRLEYVPFMRGAGHEGFEDGGETLSEARSNPFWETYWTMPGCAYPDRTGDYESVTVAGDFGSRAARRRRRVSAETPLSSMRACLPGQTAGRHYRINAWRYEDGDFGERERLALTLLRPHIEAAYWASVEASREPPPLTRRQLQLLELVREGLTNIQIAHRLDISEATVRTHLNNVYERLGISGRTAAVHAVFGSSEYWPSADRSAQ